MRDTTCTPSLHTNAGPPAGAPRYDARQPTACAVLLALLTTVDLAAQGRPATPIVDAAETSSSGKGAAAQPRRGVQFGWRDHPSVRSGRLFRADFELRLQGDVRHAADHPPDFDAVQLRRARLGVQGALFRSVQFSVERALTLADAGTGAARSRNSPWKDVWVEWNASKALQIRAGRFKVPFGLDQLTGLSQNDFVNRSLGATYLAPARDTGAMLHGRLLGRGLNYWAGLFAHDGDNARSSTVNGGGRTVAARVTATPLRPCGRPWAALEVGTAMAVSRVSGNSPAPNGLRGRTVLSDFVFFEPVFVEGARRRLEVDLDWTAGPVGVRAEYTDVRDERRRQGLGDQDLPDARARAWYVSGAWVLTGQEKRRPPARTPGQAGRNGVGVVEAVARLERLWFDSTSGQPASRSPRSAGILTNGEYATTFGANWYPSRFTTLLLGVVGERLADVERSPVPGRIFWSPMLRVQVTL